MCLPGINEGDIKEYGGEVVNVWSWFGGLTMTRDCKEATLGVPEIWAHGWAGCGSCQEV